MCYPSIYIYIYIYIYDIFYITECDYAGDITFHVCDSDPGSLINSSEHDSMLAIEWFESNYMKLNKDKCNFLLSGYKQKCCLQKLGGVEFGKVKNKSC